MIFDLSGTNLKVIPDPSVVIFLSDGGRIEILISNDNHHSNSKLKVVDL